MQKQSRCSTWCWQHRALGERRTNFKDFLEQMQHEVGYMRLNHLAKIGERFTGCIVYIHII